MPGARRPVERIDGRMLGRAEHESEQVEVLLLPVRMHRLGDDDRAVFDMPPQDHLRFGDAMRPRDAFDHTIAGIEIRATRHRRIRLDRDIVRLAIRHHLALLPRGMQFDLVDGRDDAGKFKEGGKVRLLEVADADRFCTPGFADFFECAPRLRVAARHRPVNQVKINVVETETVEAAVEGTFDITDPLRGIPYLCGNKKNY